MKTRWSDGMVLASYYIQRGQEAHEMKPLSESAYGALLLVRQNPRPQAMMPAAHSLLNANIKTLLRGGYVRYADNGRTGYALTTLGYQVTDVPRTAPSEP